MIQASEILLYQIKLEQPVPFLKLFKRKMEIVYQIVYRIDEDRIFFYKRVDGKVVTEHHTKNNINKSLLIIEGINNRLTSLHEFQSRHYYKKVYDLRIEDKSLFHMVLLISKDVEQINQEIVQHHAEERTKKPVRGMFLEGKE